MFSWDIGVNVREKETEYIEKLLESEKGKIVLVEGERGGGITQYLERATRHAEGLGYESLRIDGELNPYDSFSDLVEDNNFFVA